ncbi:MAG: ATP-binding protein [Nitrospinota bacterium]
MKSQPLNGRIILCVDDDPLHIKLLQELIESQGGRILHAGNSAETFSILEEKKPDLLLLDIKLPGMNGYEMSTKLKASRKFSAIPIVALTVLAGPNEREMAFMAGCDGYIQKPIDTNTFIPTICNYIAGRKDEPVTGEKAPYFKEYCHRLVSHVEEQLRELEAARLEWETTFNAITDMIALCDKSGTILKVNSAALRFLGVPVDEAVGKKCHQILDKQTFTPGELPIKKALVTKKSASIDISAKNPCGTFRVTVYPLPTLHRVVVVAQDISETMSGMEEQKELLENLRKTNQDLNEFAQIVSHDIKAPLRAMIAFSNLLMKEYGERLDEEGREWLGFVRQGSIKLQAMVNDILFYAKTGTEKQMAKSDIDSNALVQDIVTSLHPPPGIKIEILNSLPKLRWHETQLRQVFQNLLSNAIKSVDCKNGRISVGCKSDQGNWLFFVKDNGPGIEKKNQERIFRIFDTAGRSDPESTGLGLTMVRKLVDINGGRVWLESEPGKGTTFYFTCKKPINGKPE